MTFAVRITASVDGVCGLVPRSTGEQQRRGPITKAGNALVRRLRWKRHGTIGIAGIDRLSRDDEGTARPGDCDR